MKTRQCRFVAATGCRVITLIVMWFGVALSKAHAQNAAWEACPSADSSATSANNIAGSDKGVGYANTEILQELEKMRARIQELEAQLKGHPASEAASHKAETNKPHAEIDTNFTEASVVVPLSQAGPQQNAQVAPSQVSPAKAEPFAFADFTWLTGNSRQKEIPLDTKLFTPEVRVDVDFVHDFNHPKDNTISGSSEIFRANEVQVTQF